MTSLCCLFPTFRVPLQAPHMRNDGIVHGRFLSHAHVEGLTRDSFMLLMRVGSVFECFGRAIKLYACDTTTRVRMSPVRVDLL